jgi:hypothetical protein
MDKREKIFYQKSIPSGRSELLYYGGLYFFGGLFFKSPKGAQICSSLLFKKHESAYHNHTQYSRRDCIKHY